MTTLAKFQQLGDWDRMHCEQINATRLIKQLKALIYEMDMLRSQVQDSDLQKFDTLTDRARKNAQDAIKDYLVLNPQHQKPVWVTPQSDISANDTEDVTSNIEEETLLNQMSGLPVEITGSISSEELAKQKECLRSWENLQAEVQDIHQLFEDFSLMVQEQKEKTDEVEENVEEAAENVEEGTSHLVRAARYRATMYPIAGAVLGGCLGGPIGLIAGMKLGGLAALGCGVIGFTGGQLLKKKQQAEGGKNDVELTNIRRSSNLRGSVSLPHL
ncbi:syntaxin-17 isoform X2 [Zootermopsis nevadensis]|uniref:syntaxin-17 isoform X2 n=1 Tax=Zootermopsis nevadensis TaxID=136037 RepID=UPI000B8E8B86|nr:syntaxin-17 isoform X2 [Zootermopsis nevadensis]XP_021916919.1 syntaxin-17 isoform X2 [Zootermopsis nevadensis]